MEVFSNFYLMRDICGLNCNLDNQSCAEAGRWDVLKLRIQPGQRIDLVIFRKCAIVGNIPFMAWLTENNVKGCTSDAMDWAADNGQLEVVKWLHENRTEGCTTDA